MENDQLVPGTRVRVTGGIPDPWRELRCAVGVIIDSNANCPELGEDRVLVKFDHIPYREVASSCFTYIMRKDMLVVKATFTSEELVKTGSVYLSNCEGTINFRPHNDVIWGRESWRLETVEVATSPECAGLVARILNMGDPGNMFLGSCDANQGRFSAPGGEIQVGALTVIISPPYEMTRSRRGRKALQSYTQAHVLCTATVKGKVVTYYPEPSKS